MVWTAKNDRKLAEIIERLTGPQRIALRRANGESLPLCAPTQVRTLRCLRARKLMKPGVGYGQQLTELGRDVADRLAAKDRAGYFFPARPGGK